MTSHFNWKAYFDIGGYKEQWETLQSEILRSEKETAFLRDKIGEDFTGAKPQVKHLEAAVKTESLGVFKLEHSAQNPHVQATEKNTAALEKLAAALTSKSDSGKDRELLFFRSAF